MLPITGPPITTSSLTLRIFVPEDMPLAKNTLIYVLSHKDRETAKQSWDEFRKDPDWVKARTASEVNGPLTTQVVSVFMDPLDFSKMK